MQKSIASRTLTALLLVAMLVCALCVTVMAEKVSYDFSGYEKTANIPLYNAETPENGGWVIVPTKPFTQGGHRLYWAEGGIGMEDSASRFGTVQDGTQIIYHIPEADQVNIKDYDGIVVNRRLSNANPFAASYGAEYAIILTMDDGQTITREYKWFDGDISKVIGKGGLDVTDVDIAKDIAALNGNPKLATIAFVPYVDAGMFLLSPSALYKPAVEDDPATEDVDETAPSVYGSAYYFLMTHFDLIEASELPMGLEGSLDTFDGETVTEHNGKITGLSAEKTYKYAPVYSLDEDFVEVTGVTEISGLAGGVYEVRGVEADMLDSASVIVVVPKTAKGGFNFEAQKWDTLGTNDAIPDVKAAKSLTPIYNTWTGPLKVPYPESKTNLYHLASSYDPKYISGAEYVASSLPYAKFYRQNIVMFTYVPSLDEQFDVDEFNIEATLRYYNSPVPNIVDTSECAIRVYTNGDESNPAVVTTPYKTTTSQVAYASVRDQLDGYVTRIDFINFYTLPENQTFQTILSYNMLTQAKTYAPGKEATPVGLTIDADSEGKGAIKGLNSALTYAYSTDNATWTKVSGVTEITGLEFTTYYVKQVASKYGDYDSDAATVTIYGAAELVGEPKADGMNIVGLDADTAYEWSTVSINGFDKWEDVPAGATKLENLANGLYAIRVKKGSDHLASKAAFVYLYDYKTNRSDIVKVVDGLTTIDGTAAGGNNLMPFDIGFWSSSQYKSVKSFKDNSGFVRTWMSYPTYSFDEATAFATFLDMNVTYAMKPYQIHDIKDFNSIKVGFTATGYTTFTTVFEGNTTTTDYRARLRIFVAGSDVEYYDLEFPWTNRFDIQSNLPEDAHGYVTAIQLFPFARIPEGRRIQDSIKDDPNGVNYEDGRPWDPTGASNGRSLPAFIDIYEVNIATAEYLSVDELSYEGYLDGYRIFGLDTTKLYAYSTDNVKWNALDLGADSFYVKNAENIYVKLLANGSALESNVVELSLSAVNPAVTGLEYADGVITGFDADLSYEYRAVNAMDDEWTAIEAGTTELAVEAGVWAVRLAADDTAIAGAAQYVVVKGEKYGNIAWGKPSTESAGFVQGYWTSADKKVYNDPIRDIQLYPTSTVACNNVRLAQGWAGDYDDRMNYYYRYALENGEVFPVVNLNNITLSTWYGAGNPWNSSLFTALVRVYVEGGEVDFYETTASYSQWTLTTFFISDVVPDDAKGYVTAIDVYPIYEIEGDKTRKTPSGNYPVMRIASYDNDPSIEASKTATEKWRCDFFVPDAPSGIKLVAPEAGAYLTGYKITGFDADVAYECSVNGSAFTALADGTTELSVTAGVYRIRVAATETEESSATVVLNVPMINPVFGNRDQFAYTSLVDRNFNLGKWVGNLNKFSTGEVNVTSYIGPKQVLSEVSYKYKLYEHDYFVVDEHPYFSIDFNNEMPNMGIKAEFITGAVMAIDIYVEGEDTPYTITTEWKGKSKVNGYTANKYTVNLLDEYPALAGKTVVAIDIRPYSNLEHTPNDYNVSATADRYLYFRLIYLGFFDSPANTDATALNTNVAVNTFTGLKAESDVVYGIGATPKASDFTVYETFSDGSVFEITNFEIVVPEGFGAEAGTYTVTVNGRLNSTATVNAAVGLESIAIKTNPDKTEYFDGDTLDLTGLEVVAILGNGEEIPVTKYEVNVETVALDTTSVTVSYGGMEVTFDIIVNEVTVESIAINTWPDKELAGGYLEGDPVDLTGLTIKATYNNGKTEILGLDKIDAVYGAEVMTRGTKMTISYGGKTISGFILTVSSKSISDVVISVPADKLSYVVGEELDTTGLELTVNYEDGTTAIFTDGFIATADLTVAGEVEVTILYEGFTVTYTVTVREIETAFILTPPTKLEYVVGEELDPTGIEFMVLYTDGESETLTEGFEFIYDAFTEAGEYEVVLKYYDFEEPFIVIVVEGEEPEVVLESITVTAPTKTEYTVGDTLALAGMVVTANYSDGTTADVTADATVDTTVLEVVGTVTVTVTYEGMTAEFDVTVNPVPVVLESITVTAPTKTEYTVGDTLALAGMVVTANYSDGTTADVTAKATVDTTALNVAGTVTVTVTFDGKTATFKVTVAEKVVEPEEPENIAEGTIGTINWVITTDGTLTVSGEGAIPNYTRTEVAPWNAYFKQIKKIVVAEGVTAIGDYAFYNLAKVTTIDVAKTVVSVGVQFIRGTAITEIDLSNVVTVAANALGRADSLASVTFGEVAKNFKGSIFYSETVTVKAPENSYADKYVELYDEKYGKAYPDVSVSFEAKGTAARPVVVFESAGDNAFFAIYQRKANVWDLEISGSGAMRKYANVADKNIEKGLPMSPMYELTLEGLERNIFTINVREGLTTVGNYIFYKCTKVTSLTLPEGIKTIGQGAFRLVQRVTTFNLPESVTEIQPYAFLSCLALTEIYIPEGVTTVGYGIFNKCTLENITVKTKSEAAIAVISAEYPTVKIVTDF